jgi:hypothetical protein
MTLFFPFILKSIDDFLGDSSGFAQDRGAGLFVRRPAMVRAGSFSLPRSGTISLVQFCSTWFIFEAVPDKKGS